MKTIIQMPFKETDIEILDRIAIANHTTRSEIIRQAVSRYLEAAEAILAEQGEKIDAAE